MNVQFGKTSVTLPKTIINAFVAETLASTYSNEAIELEKEAASSIEARQHIQEVFDKVNFSTRETENGLTVTFEDTSLEGKDALEWEGHTLCGLFATLHVMGIDLDKATVASDTLGNTDIQQIKNVTRIAVDVENVFKDAEGLDGF